MMMLHICGPGVVADVDGLAVAKLGSGCPSQMANPGKGPAYE